MAKVIIIGAGLAGLSTAYLLQKRGYEVLVLEASGRAGGRMRTLERSGDRVDVGAQFFHSNYRRTLALIDEMGMSPTKRKIPEDAVFCLEDGSRYVLNQHLPYIAPLGLRGNAKLLALLLKYVVFGQRFSLYRIDRDIPEYDDVPALTLCDSPSDQHLKDFFVEPMTMGPPEQLSLYHVIRSIRFNLLSRPIGLTGGVASLAEALASRLPVRLESPVKQLVMEKGRVVGVQLQADGSVERAEHTVVAVTPSAAAALMPQEMERERQFFDSILAHELPLPVLFLDRRVDEKLWIYFNRPDLREGVMHATDETTKLPEMVPSGKSIFTVWFGSPTNTDLMSEPDDRVIEAAREGMEPMLPGFSQWIEDAIVVRHPYVVAGYDLGAHRRVLDFLERAETLTGVYFAGDLFGGCFMESAVQSSAAVVEKIRAAEEGKR
jgi:oxygen-dependent protoporphyrinogen oxidase